MNNRILTALVFMTGAAVGSLVTWKVVKTKYEQIAQEEIDSTKEEYDRLKNLMRKEIEACRRITDSNKEGEQDCGNETDETTPDADEDYSNNSDQLKIEYYNMTSRYRGTSDEPEAQPEKKGVKWEEEENDDEEDDIPNIYVISPDDFAHSPPGYSAQPLDYYADGILADGWGVALDIDETIGEESLQHFGEYVDDIIYVRNERLEIDYEVSTDPRTYAEATQTNL